MRRILVIDDDLDFAYSLCMCLRTEGHEADYALAPLTGLSHVRLFKPTVVILDLALPDIEGSQLVLQLRSIPGMSDSLIIAATGLGRPEQKLALVRGCDYVLQKPFNVDALYRMVLERPRA